MAKTYNTIPTVSTGEVYTATAHNNIVENVENYRVPPMCRLRLNATASIAHNTDTVCPFDTSDFDTDGMGTTGASAKITIQTNGVYLVSAAGIFAANATGNRVMTVRKNASGAASTVTGLASGTNFTALGSAYFASSMSVLLSLVATDYIDFQVFQNSGGALNIGVATPSATYLSAVWVGQVS